MASTWKCAMKFTKSIVEKIPIPQDRDQMFYRDNHKGFGLRVTRNGVKSFVVEKLIGGKVRRITLGRFGDLTVEQARKEAEKLLGKIATGIDPIAEKQTAKAQKVTLKEVLEDYKQARKNLKPKTIYDYERAIKIAFADWQSKSLFSITKEQVIKKHVQLGKENGHAYANLAMRVLRAMINFAMEQYEDSQGRPIITDNPIKRLSKTRAWYRINRRRNYIKPNELFDWYNAVIKLKNESVSDYLVFILLTGLRRNEAAQLEKTSVNLNARMFTIVDPKNHEPHTLPLTDYLAALLKRRMEASPNKYVFPSIGQVGYLIEPRKQLKKIIKTTNIQFTIHDLRRTFITIAESLDISAYSLKRLLNHKMDSNDVTAGYIITDVERLRQPMQKIGDFIIAKCLEKPKENDSPVDVITEQVECT